MDPEDHRKTGNELLVTGVGVGAIGVAGAVLLGATCPVCVVATPALIGAGLYKRWRARRAADVLAAEPATDPTRSEHGEPSG